MKRSSFQLKEQAIIDIDYKVNEFYSQSEEDLKIDVQTAVKKVGDNIAAVYLTVNLFKNEDFQSVPFSMTVKSRGIFTWDSELEKTALTSLLQNNAPAILYSFIRPIVSNLTAFSIGGSLILPLLNFSENCETINEFLD